MPRLDLPMIEILATLAPSQRDYILPRIGVEKWQAREAKLQNRNAALRDLADRHFPAMHARSQAIAIATRYGSMSYKPTPGSIPPRNLDDRDQAIMRVADLGFPAKFPGWRHIARVLVESKRNDANSAVEMRHCDSDYPGHGSPDPKSENA